LVGKRRLEANLAIRRLGEVRLPKCPLGEEIEILATEASPASLAGPIPDGPVLLSIKDAAKHLGIFYGVLYELMNRGEMDYVRIGRRRLVSRDALNKFIEANTQSGYSKYRG